VVVVGCGVAMGLGSSPEMGGEHLEIIKKEKKREEFHNKNLVNLNTRKLPLM